MAEVIWTETALQSLDEIADYIALDEYDAACRFVRKVFDKVDLLQENPGIGTAPRELNGTPYRRLVIKPVYVYYRVEGQSVVIVFVDRNERELSISRFAR
mgnify:FL=1